MHALYRGIVAALFLMTGSVQAQEHGFKGVRVITLKEATSACIGKPVSPLCAAETFLACSLRNDKTLCDTVGANPFGPQKAVKEKYKFKALRTMSEGDFRRLDGVEWARPGNVVVTLQTSVCFPDRYCSPYERYSIILSAAKDRTWLVIGWDSEAQTEEFGD